MTRTFRPVLLVSFLVFSSIAFLGASHPATAERSSQDHFQLVLELAPVGSANSFSVGTVDMQFTGSERDWNAASGTVNLRLPAGETLPSNTTFLGGLSWSTSAAELPVPPDDVTFSLFSNEVGPYRVMIETTPETLFMVLSQTSSEATMVVHGTIQLHVSVGTRLAVNEMVQVRGHAVYSSTN